MGTGYHGGFGKTTGSLFAIKMSPTFAGDDDQLKKASKVLKPKSGYTDIIVHGGLKSVAVKHHGKWVSLDQRRLANMYKNSGEKSDNPIRLVSCKTGAINGNFAQNLANKLGKKVIAPSDTLWILPNGNTIIGNSPTKNTGKWIAYYPRKKRGDKK